MYQNGSVQLVREGGITRKVDLWLTFDQEEGYLKVRDVLDALDWDDVFYIDAKGFEIQLSAHACGELQGFSTDRFHADQILNVSGRKFSVNEDPGAALYDVRYGAATIPEVGVEPSLLGENDNFRVLMAFLRKATTTMTEIRELFETQSKLNVV